MNKKIIFTLILISYIVVIIFISINPNMDNSLPRGTDKVVHFVEFFILTLILLKTLSFYNVTNKLIILCIITLIIAIASELIQIPVPSRAFSLFDLGADILGIISALAIKWKSLKQ